jgi:hypothetical protein
VTKVQWPPLRHVGIAGFPISEEKYGVYQAALSIVGVGKVLVAVPLASIAKQETADLREAWGVFFLKYKAPSLLLRLII